MNKSIIKFENVSKNYGKNQVIDDLNFEVNKGEFITVLGASGCGKTTSLKMINGLEKPTSGDVIVAGHSIRNGKLIEFRRHIGYVVQSIGLFPHMTVAQNIAVTPKLLGWDQNKIDKRTNELLDLVNLPLDFKKRYPAQLSGGQQQRVGVARALSANPPLLLFDEPFSALDALIRQDLQKQLKEIHRTLQNKTFYFVTHDINEALYLGDRVMIMNHGKIEQFDSPEELVKQPRTEYVKQLLNTVQQNKDLWEKLQ